MAMTQFEKALISELQAIRKELSKLNKKEPQKGFDELSIDAKELSNRISTESLLNNSLRSGERATFHR